MTIESVICAICDNHVPLDQEHVRISPEWITREPTDDEYFIHTDCWFDLTDDWTDPV